MSDKDAIELADILKFLFVALKKAQEGGTNPMADISGKIENDELHLIIRGEACVIAKNGKVR